MVPCFASNGTMRLPGEDILSARQLQFRPNHGFRSRASGPVYSESGCIGGRGIFVQRVFMPNIGVALAA